MNKLQKSSRFISKLKNLSIILGYILLCPLLVTILSTFAPYFNQSDYGYVGENFAEALMQNNSRLARRLSAPSQWERIDEWMSRHEPLRCLFTWDFDDFYSSSMGGLDDRGAHVSYYQMCAVDGYYEFKIEEIMLQMQKNRWQVVEWSEVQELKE